ALFRGPTGIAVDAAGNLLVADTFNSTIRTLAIPSLAAQTGLTGTSAVSVSAALTDLSPGSTYSYRVVASSSGGTALGTTVSFAPALAPPATTQAASAITLTGATLNGTVNPNSASTNTFFQYATNPDLAAGVIATLAGTPAAGGADGTGRA